MNVLVLGGAGYVGAVLCRHLARTGHNVRIADVFLFSNPEAFAKHSSTQVVDVRALVPDDFAGVDAVLNLAALSNDPSGALDPFATYAINVDARVRSAELARAAGVRRYILFSSCSVYGANDRIADETASLHPLTAYAIANVRAEKGILPLNDDRFCVTAVRLATVFGLSPSMRFDLAINTMTLNAFADRRVTINGDGLQHRPFIHVRDVARAAARVLEFNPGTVGGEIFNIVNFNLRIRDLAERVRALFGDRVELEFVGDNPDARNYHVGGAKAERLLGFVPEVGLEQGAAAMMAALREGRVRPDFASIRLNGYRKLIADGDLYGGARVHDGTGQALSLVEAVRMA